MKRNSLLLAIALAPVATATPVGGQYSIPRSTIDGGGGHLSGPGFELDASVGQPDTQRLSGGEFSLAGGFWPDGEATTGRLFADGFE